MVRSIALIVVLSSFSFSVLGAMMRSIKLLSRSIGEPLRTTIEYLFAKGGKSFGRLLVVRSSSG
ncbi:hypothetical protein [Pseudobacteriovorax antillogorgiicola]|uniref:Uncharacterized protein n=1 Tax=Pseudobacteriovorax antillogorgiicola TaxID=1513793 RepID=A0A1Y6CFP7_9BACT|nr:hypothetical protein [Pseudobacteriovorax antillogorgiicola]TCS47303.1 hypothetical protein EDD56_12178 [Pseudobacteriovorax antillogorgiicola]SMF62581.1 hypothetical protein SAMN06296036_12178 [Pseudobacteriovorax antillogorgiicola]